MMITYTIIAEGIPMMENPISEYEIMQMCRGGGVTAFNSGTTIEFLDKDSAIKAKETLKANGVKLLSDIIEADNPWIIGDEDE